MKTCKVCGDQKDHDSFGRRSDSPDGLNARCKDCRNASLRARKAKFDGLPAHKTCSRCSETKPLSEYHLNRNHRDGRSSRCKTCAKVVASAWNRAHPETRLDQRRKYRHGMTNDDYLALLESQDYKCAICRGGPSSKRNNCLVIDHCHNSGRIRGLLCDDCNIGLGVFKDDPSRLRLAIDYLGNP